MELSSIRRSPVPRIGPAHGTGGFASVPPQVSAVVKDKSLRSAAELAEDFDKRVQVLPPELVLLIYEEVSTAGSEPQGVIIHDYYRPPALMHIDRKSRDRSAKSYYSSDIFRVRDTDNDTCRHRDRSIGSSYIGCLRQIRYGVARPSHWYGKLGDPWIAAFADRERHHLIHLFKCWKGR